MDQIVLLIHAVVGILFILIVLAQDKGTGLSAAIGGGSGGGFYASQRGAAKVFHILSIVLASVFILTALIYATLPQTAQEVVVPETTTQPAETELPFDPSNIEVETQDGSAADIQVETVE